MIMRLYMLKDLVRKGEQAKNIKDMPSMPPGSSKDQMYPGMGFGGPDGGDFNDPYA